MIDRTLYDLWLVRKDVILLDITLPKSSLLSHDTFIRLVKFTLFWLWCAEWLRFPVTVLIHLITLRPALVPRLVECLTVSLTSDIVLMVRLIGPLEYMYMYVEFTIKHCKCDFYPYWLINISINIQHTQTLIRILGPKARIWTILWSGSSHVIALTTWCIIWTRMLRIIYWFWSFYTV